MFFYGERTQKGEPEKAPLWVKRKKTLTSDNKDTDTILDNALDKTPPHAPFADDDRVKALVRLLARHAAERDFYSRSDHPTTRHNPKTGKDEP